MDKKEGYGGRKQGLKISVTLNIMSIGVLRLLKSLKLNLLVRNDTNATCLRPPRHRASGGAGEFHVGTSSISPPFWFGASSTSVQLCSKSSNKSGVTHKIIETRIENRKNNPQLVQHAQKTSLGALGGQSRSKVEKTEFQ